MFRILLFLPILIFTSANCEKLTEIFKWKQIEFESDKSTSGSPDVIFPDQLNDPYSHRRPLIQHGNKNTNFDYIAYNNVPMGVTHHKNRLFITIPRRRLGIPATLNYISTVNPSNSSPKLKAYPNYEMNKIQVNARPGEETFISVYRTSVDACNRLWFVDTGMLEYPDNRTQVQQPSIWIFDLNTNTRIHRFEIPHNIVNDGRGLASIAIDVNDGNCNDAFGYIPDLYMRAIYVYSLRQNRIWAFSHNYFSFDPLWGDLDIAGQQFQWNDGIFSITLGKRNPDGFRSAYFHPMISISEFSVSTKVLQNETNSQRSYHGNDFKYLGNRGPLKQSSRHEYDPRTGAIIFAEIANSGVGCWNTNKKLSEQNYVTLQKNDKTMIYPSDLTIDSEGTVWIMTNSMPLFIYSSLNPNEYNFRVWKQSVEKLIENTPCDSQVQNIFNGIYS